MGKHERNELEDSRATSHKWQACLPQLFRGDFFPPGSSRWTCFDLGARPCRLFMLWGYQHALNLARWLHRIRKNLLSRKKVIYRPLFQSFQSRIVVLHPRVALLRQEQLSSTGLHWLITGLFRDRDFQVVHRLVRADLDRERELQRLHTRTPLSFLQLADSRMRRRLPYPSTRSWRKECGLATNGILTPRDQRPSQEQRDLFLRSTKPSTKKVFPYVVPSMAMTGDGSCQVGPKRHQASRQQRDVAHLLLRWKAVVSQDLLMPHWALRQQQEEARRSQVQGVPLDYSCPRALHPY
jgi:hypothetical protein